VFTQDRDKLRQAWCDAWRKFREQQPLEPLERQIGETVARHPEYQPLLEGRAEAALGREYKPETGETNPFMHMGMHLAIREQLASNRPDGIVAAYQTLLLLCGDEHAVEHQMMECLGEALWQAQRAGRPPDEQAYLACVERLGRG